MPFEAASQVVDILPSNYCRWPTHALHQCLFYRLMDSCKRRCLFVSTGCQTMCHAGMWEQMASIPIQSNMSEILPASSAAQAFLFMLPHPAPCNRSAICCMRFLQLLLYQASAPGQLHAGVFRCSLIHLHILDFHLQVIVLMCWDVPWA